MAIDLPGIEQIECEGPGYGAPVLLMAKASLLKPSSKRRHIIPMSLVLGRFAEIGVRPPDSDIVAVDPGHDTNQVPPAAADRHLHA